MTRRLGLPSRWHRLSVRRALLSGVLPVMLIAVAIELLLTWHTAVEAANAAYDRSLLGAIKAIDTNISTDSGGLAVELPYRMLEFFQLTASGEVYFRVSTDDGLVEVGNAGLPLPAHPLVTGVPHFIDAQYFGHSVRVGSWARELDRPIGSATGARRLVIQVAESTNSRNAFSRALLLQALGRDALTIVLVTATLVGVIGWALGPLERLRGEVQARADDDIAPIDDSSVPLDVVPLVRAINHHLQRQREQIEGRRRFVDDASHQLRTPLATLSMQVSYALRERDPARVSEALEAIKLQLDDTVRRTNQMLMLARADLPELPLETRDLNTLAERSTREAWPLAREHGIDLGFEPAPGPLPVTVQDTLLREAVANLLHNALRYTPAGSSVTLRLWAEPGLACLAVLDDGPGIPAAERARAGERFFRASNVQQPGSGLGLAIVRSVAQRHGGQMQVAPARIDPDGTERGCAVTMRLPLSSHHDVSTESPLKASAA